MKTYSREEVVDLLAGQDLLAALATIDRWLSRGDGAAVYRNSDFGHPELGHVQIVSFGSEHAQLETDEPPKTLPDIGHSINWRYQLEGVYRRAAS